MIQQGQILLNEFFNVNTSSFQNMKLHISTEQNLIYQDQNQGSKLAFKTTQTMVEVYKFVHFVLISTIIHHPS